MGPLVFVTLQCPRHNVVVKVHPFIAAAQGTSGPLPEPRISDPGASLVAQLVAFELLFRFCKQRCRLSAKWSGAPFQTPCDFDSAKQAPSSPAGRLPSSSINVHSDRNESGERQLFPNNGNGKVARDWCRNDVFDLKRPHQSSEFRLAVPGYTLATGRLTCPVRPVDDGAET
jgi:hypothetical protein